MAPEEYKGFYRKSSKADGFTSDYQSRNSMEYYYQSRKLSYMKDELQKLVSGSTNVILDLGTGSGKFLDIIRNLSLEPLRVGVDLSPVNCSGVSQKGHFCMMADGEQLPIKSSSVDLVLLLDIIEHLAEPWQLLSEVWRALKNHGILLLSTPSKLGIYEYKELVNFGFPDTLRDLLTLKMFFQKPRSYHPFHIKLYTEAEICSILRQAGFHIIRSTKINFCLPFLGNFNHLFDIYKSAWFLKLLNVMEKGLPLFNWLILLTARKEKHNNFRDLL